MIQTTRKKLNVALLIAAGLLCVLVGAFGLLYKSAPVQVSASDDGIATVASTEITSSYTTSISDLYNMTFSFDKVYYDATKNEVMARFHTNAPERIYQDCLRSQVVLQGDTHAKIVFVKSNQSGNGNHDYATNNVVLPNTSFMPYYDMFDTTITYTTLKNNYSKYISIVESEENLNDDNYLNTVYVDFPVEEGDYRNATYYALIVFDFDFEGKAAIVGLSNRIDIGEDILVGNLLKRSNVDLSNLEQYDKEFQREMKLLSLWENVGNKTVDVRYLEMQGFNRPMWVTDSYSVKEEYFYNTTIVEYQIKNLMGFDDYSYFDAIYKNYNYAIDGQAFLLQEKICRQAIGFNYSAGRFDISYSPFEYSDFYIRVQNNDPLNNLTMDFYTTNVEADGNNYTIRFNYSDVQTMLYNSCHWLCELDATKFDITGVSPSVTVVAGENDLSLTFNKNNQNALFGIDVTATAEIVEDIEYAVTYEYKQVNDDLSIETKTSDPFTLWYKELQNLKGSNFYAKFGAIIDEAINPTILNGQTYMSFKDTKTLENHENHSAVIQVLYTHNTLVECRSNISDEVVSVKALNYNTLDYRLSDFDFKVPEGWRIKSLTCADEGVVRISWNDKTPAESTIRVLVNTKDERIITLNAELTDKWPVKIHYFKPYKDSCFLEKSVFETEIKVSEYDAYALTAKDFAKIMGVNSIDLLNLATVDEKATTMQKKGDTYVYDIAYTHAILKKTNYDGTFDEVKVPITAYSDWTKSFGKDWSILMLNTPQDPVFKYSNDVELENLYGFFSVAVFEEQVSDLNYWLQQYSGNGCKTVFEAEEYSGSGLYKWFANHDDKLGMMFCELVNDDNKIYHSYFFYLDGTSNLSFLALNGADEYDDNQSAGENFLEDVGDFFVNTWNSVADWFNNNPTGQVVKWVLIGLAGLIVVGLVVWIITFFVRKIRGY